MTTQMYMETTRSIKVTVDPFYVAEQSAPDENRYVFGYTVTLQNLGTDRVQLISRHWKIIDGLGRQSEVKGDGVIGKQPTLEPGSHFSYTSGAPLPTPTGIMLGTYQMRNDDGLWFDVTIPAFSLDAPFAKPQAN